MFGAAGAVEAMMCALALHEGTLPPTINYRTPDPECDLDYVPNEARHTQVEVALSNAMGLGGHNACVLLGRRRSDVSALGRERPHVLVTGAAGTIGRILLDGLADEYARSTGST